MADSNRGSGDGFDTLSLHAGQRPDPATGARATPIYQSAAFVFPDTDSAAGLFNIERAGHVYSRLSNPTNAVLEERVAALEGGVGAIATASGQAAMHLAVVTLCSAGDHIVASRSIYGGTHNLLAYTLPRFGITTTFVDPRDPAAFAAAIQPNTRLVFGETLGNPGLEVLNVPAVARVAHAAALPLLIDSTFTTPYLMRPIECGADLILHSATKFLSGHGIVIGGVLVDGGTFDWEAAGTFATMTEPYAGFHDLIFAEEFGPAAFITRARKEGLRDFGACMAPTTAFHILQGLETLSLRMERHVANARRVAEFLEAHAGVNSVSHPDLTEPSRSRARAGTIAARRRRRVVVRYRRRSRRWTHVHREPDDLFASRECRRREVAGHSSGEHDASSDGRGRVARGGHRRRARAVVDRSRRCRRSARRPRSCAAPRAAIR